MLATEVVKEKSKLTKEEWREYTKTVWSIANTSDPNHPAVFPLEIPHRLIKLFTFYGEAALIAARHGTKSFAVKKNNHFPFLL